MGHTGRLAVGILPIYAFISSPKRSTTCSAISLRTGASWQRLGKEKNVSRYPKRAITT